MIPNEYHFVWFGKTFPFTHALAIRSLAATSRPEAIHLYHSDLLEGEPHFDALLRDIPPLRLHPIEIDQILEESEGIDRGALLEAYCTLEGVSYFAAMSDLLRYLILYRGGGVYLDLDVLVLRDLRPLLQCRGFCGRERILVPAALSRRRFPFRYFRTVPLDIARAICARTDRGLRWFSKIETLYPAAVNGAVLGLMKSHPLAREALHRLPPLVSRVSRRRTSLGPDLLQDLIEGRGFPDVTVFDPPYFYPLGPYMAAHLFRTRDDLQEARDRVVHQDTHLLHWYNDNLRHLPRPLDPASLRALAPRQLFSNLALPFAKFC